MSTQTISVAKAEVSTRLLFCPRLAPLLELCYRLNASKIDVSRTIIPSGFINICSHQPKNPLYH